MACHFGALCDGFHASSRLVLKMDLTLERETILQFFDRVRKVYPRMDRMQRRESGALVLEEKTSGEESRRWLRLEPSGLRFGYMAPPDAEAVVALADVVLENAPYYLSLSELDFDHLELMYGFDLEYAGNHDQLVAETFWTDHPFSSFILSDPARHVIDAQPYLGIALTPGCDLQAYVEVKSRTSTYEVRTGEYEPQPLTVFLTVRKYWSGETQASLAELEHRLAEVANHLAEDKVVPTLVNPLAQAIARQL